MSLDFRRWAALVIVCFGQLMIVLDSTIVNVALPSMQRDLHLDQAALTWVVNSYLIAFGSFLLVAGRAGDLIGRRKVFLAGIFLFTVASFGTGISEGAQSLIVGRFLQGLGGSMSAGVILAIIVPIGIATIVAGALLIEENEGAGLTQGIDVLGALLITAAMMLGVYAIVTAAGNGWTSRHTLVFGGGSLALLAAFVGLESRLRSPLMPLRILRLRSLTGSSAVRAFLFAGMFTNFFIGSLYLQHIKGLDAIGIGLAFLPTTVTLAALSGTGITARLMARYGARNLAIVGLLIITSALFVLSGADESSSYFPRMLVAYFLFGLGAGTAFLPLLSISMSEVPAADAGLATGFGNVAMQIGAAVGLAAVGTISTAHTHDLVAQGEPLQAALTSGYQLAFLLAASSVALGLLVVLAVLRPSRTGLRHASARIAAEEAEAEAA